MLPLLDLDCTCDEALNRVKDILDDAGLRVMMSFDSHLTRPSPIPVACPHHGTDTCDCQVVILLIYDVAGRPATILAHGQDGETWISLAVAPGQQPPARLEGKIKQALALLSRAQSEAND